MRQLLLGTRRPSTVVEALLVALILLAGLAAGIYGMSLLFDDVDHQRNLIVMLGIPSLRLVFDLLSVLNGRE